MELLVLDPRWLAAPGRWHARVQFPDRRHPTEILIFARAASLTGVRARCPHEGHDLSEVPLDPDGRLVCPRHSLPIGVYGTPCAGFYVQRRDNLLLVPWPLLPPIP